MLSRENEALTYLQQEIKKLNTKQNVQHFLYLLIRCLFLGSFCCFLLQLYAMFFCFYYVNPCCLLVLILSILTAAVLSILKPVSLKRTTLFMDSFGFQEGITTAWENREQSSAVLSLQRSAVVKELKENRERIHLRVFPSLTLTGPVFLFLLLTILLSLLPSPAKTTAMEIMQLKKEQNLLQEEIEKVLDTLEQADASTLTEQEQVRLQELRDNLLSSMAELQQANSREDLQLAEEKLDYKLQDFINMNPRLSTKLELDRKQFQVSDSSSQDGSGNSGKEGDSDSSSQSGSGDSGKEGDSDSSSQNGSGSSGKEGDSDSSSQSGSWDSGKEGGSDSSSQSGLGDSGKEGDSGNGDNSNGASGSGSSQKKHDYISIPGKEGNQDPLSGQVEHKDENLFLDRNGLNWEGEHTSYREVIGDYTDQAYEGISQGKYPKGMEDIIKKYFSEFQ